MAKKEETSEVSAEEILTDIWQHTHRTEALLSVILRSQAEIISKVSGISLDQALEQINSDIQEQFDAMNEEEEEA